MEERCLKVGFVALLILFLSLHQSVFAAGEDLDSSRRELEEIRQRIGKTSRTLEEKNRAEKLANSDLKKVEKSLERMTSRVNAINSDLNQLRGKIKRAESELGQTGAQIDGLSHLVKQRLVALYKGGEIPLAQSLFTPGPAADVSNDFVYLQRIVEHDRELLGGYQLRLNHQSQNLQNLAALREKQLRLKQEMEKERREMVQLTKMKEDLLVQVRKDKNSLSQQLADLQGRAKRIDGLIRNFETKRNRQPAAPGTAFAGQKGQLSWPVNGRVRIPFGNSRHPDLGTPYQSHGIEIEVSGDLPVKSVWSGKVVFANAFKGYNNLLIIDHGDSYYTLYAQTASLNCKVGDKISQGQVVAQTDGSTGRFYFEIRKGGNPLDPKQWLR
ncbi:MAG: peptidoglycan DD-metalloendopeptidase family protein [Desulfuromonadales bacterium]|nr:peptidoglycan DD-metalloendopeptidase family protein [Desulfuromonadales bacterium]